jgi:SAM-dependent methyltransferase
VLREALDVLQHPERAPGWAFTDPVILDGWGRGSAVVPGIIAGLTPDLAEVTDFLDVGTGVGLLAVAAASTWPGASVVGIDTWGPSLERAAANVAGAGLDERITLRSQDVGAVDDVDRFDCIWVPTFFLTEPAVADALPALVAAARPGGWIVLGRFEPGPDPVAAAAAAFKTLRNGGCDLTADAAEQLLASAGCEAIESKRPGGPVPLGFTIGCRPAG